MRRYACGDMRYATHGNLMFSFFLINGKKNLITLGQVVGFNLIAELRVARRQHILSSIHNQYPQ